MDNYDDCAYFTNEVSVELFGICNSYDLLLFSHCVVLFDIVNVL